MDLIEIVDNNIYNMNIKANNISGTIPYMSPESFDGVICTSNDMWSCGVILYALMDGHFPFEINNNMSNLLKQKILRQTKPKFDPFIWGDNKDLSDLCLRLLDPNPLTRIQNAREALMHYCFNHII